MKTQNEAPRSKPVAIETNAPNRWFGSGLRARAFYRLYFVEAVEALSRRMLQCNRGETSQTGSGQPRHVD